MTNQAQQVVAAVKSNPVANAKKIMDDAGAVYSHTYAGNLFYTMPDASELVLNHTSLRAQPASH